MYEIKKRISHTFLEIYIDMWSHTFVDGYCSTVQGLLDWFEVDLGFTDLSSIRQCLFGKSRDKLYDVFFNDFSKDFFY